MRTDIMIDDDSVLVDILATALYSTGVDESLLTQFVRELVRHSDDTRRLGYCLAIDLKEGAISKGEILAALQACQFTNADSLSDFAKALSSRCGVDFETCTAPIGQGDLTAVPYGSAMTIMKFMRFFRGREGRSLNEYEIVAEIDALVILSGDEGHQETALHGTLRSYARPVTWIAPHTTFQELCYALGTTDTAADQIADVLGLSWPSGPTHHMVLLVYPAEASNILNIRRPTALSECWEDPGLFVSTIGNHGGWGLTASRSEPTKGVPERVHGPLSQDTYVPLYSRYIGKVSLKPIERGGTAAEARRRWMRSTQTTTS